MIDENGFFRNATLGICGSLRIEEGLRDCFEFISQHLPADALYLERNDYELGAMRIMARATATSCERTDALMQ